ncbi:MAG: ArsA family ATPase [Cyclobacteriaceae bacterium]
MNELFRKLIFVGGKGGVGKTTIATSLATSLAKKGSTILISTDPAHSVSDSLQKKAVSTIAHCAELQFHYWEIKAEEEYQKFIDLHREQFKLIFDTSTYLDESDVDKILSLLIPGIDEIMSFKAIIDLINKDEYEYFVIDTAPTGHTLRLLTIPHLLDEWIKQLASLRWKYRQIQKTFTGKYAPDAGDDMMLDLKKSVLKMKKLLADTKVSQFMIVTKPEQMVLDESIRMAAELKDANINLTTIIVNNVMPDNADGAFCDAIRSAQRPHIKALDDQFNNIKTCTFPMHTQPINGTKAFSQFSSFTDQISLDI